MKRKVANTESEIRQMRMDEIELEKEEEADEDAIVPLHYAITSYGADYPVDGLVKRLREGSIEIPPSNAATFGAIGQHLDLSNPCCLGSPCLASFYPKK